MFLLGLFLFSVLKLEIPFPGCRNWRLILTKFQTLVVEKVQRAPTNYQTHTGTQRISRRILNERGRKWNWWCKHFLTRAKGSPYGMIWSSNSCVDDLKQYKNVHTGKSLSTIRRILPFPYSYVRTTYKHTYIHTCIVRTYIHTHTHAISLRRIPYIENGTEIWPEVPVIIYQSKLRLIPELLQHIFIFFRAGYFLISWVTSTTSRKPSIIIWFVLSFFNYLQHL
jgi:hypothetical protein